MYHLEGPKTSDNISETLTTNQKMYMIFYLNVKNDEVIIKQQGPQLVLSMNSDSP